jgi:hypothetical protein
MTDLQCPACGGKPLGKPYQFGGNWFAACHGCHVETALSRGETAAGARFDYAVPAGDLSLRAADLYRRRTVF